MMVTAIDQWHCVVDKNKKKNAVVKLLSMNQSQMALVFCNTKRMTDNLAGRLKKQNISSAAQRGDMDQHTRNRVMKGRQMSFEPATGRN